MSKVENAVTADGSTGWFKIYEDGWNLNPSGKSADDDYWGTKDMSTCCGQIDAKIPLGIAPGDYLLRAEALALHVAAQPQGAQFYMSCYQLAVSGNGTDLPPTVKFPGAYTAKDPGILFDIHSKQTAYIVPGPSLYPGGWNKSAGSGCGTLAGGCKSTCVAGKGPTGTAQLVAIPQTAAAEAGAGSAACAGSMRQVAAYQQCGGTGFAGDGCASCPVSLLPAQHDVWTYC